MTRRRVVVCTSDEDLPRCGSIVFEDVSYFEQEECEDSGEVVEEDGFRAALRFERGDAIVTALPTSPQPPPADLVGRHPIGDVLGPVSRGELSAF